MAEKDRFYRSSRRILPSVPQGIKDPLVREFLERLRYALEDPPQTYIRLYTASLNPASIAASTTAEETFTVSGITTDDKVYVVKPTLTAGVGIVNARVPGNNQVAITFVNATAGAVNPAQETYTILALREQSA